MRESCGNGISGDERSILPSGQTMENIYFETFHYIPFPLCEGLDFVKSGRRWYLSIHHALYQAMPLNNQTKNRNTPQKTTSMHVHLYVH